jgi:hypothetical protein
MKGHPLRGGDNRVLILRLRTRPFGSWPRRLPGTGADFASQPGLASWACHLPLVPCAKGGWVPADRWRARGIVYRSSGPWPVIAGARPRNSIALRDLRLGVRGRKIRAWSSLASTCRWRAPRRLLRRLLPQALVRTVAVIVLRELSQDRAEMPFAEDRHPVGDAGPGGEREPTAGQRAAGSYRRRR